MATLDTLLNEINQSLAVMEPQHEGLRDFASLDIQEGTKQEVEASIAQFDRRLDLVLKAKEALERLRDDGWPRMDVREIATAALQDLQANAATIAAALALFASGQAIALHLSAGFPEPR